MPDSPAAPRFGDRELAARLLERLRPYRWRVVLAVVLLLSHSIVGVSGPYLAKVAVDCCLQPVENPSPLIESFVPLTDDPVRGLGVVVGLFLAALVLGYALRAAQIRVMNRTGQNAMYDLRREVFSHLQSLPVQFFDRNRVGRLVTRITNDVETLNELFTSGVAAIAGDLLTLIFIFAAMIYLSPHLTGALLLLAPFAIGLTWLFRSRARAGYRRMRGAVGRISAFIQEQVSGISIIQLSTREDDSRAEFDGLNRDHLRGMLQTLKAYCWFFPSAELLATAGMVVVLLVGGLLIDRGMLTIGVVVAFMQYGTRIFRPLQDLSDKFNVVQSAMAGAERIFQLLDEPISEPLSDAADGPGGSSDAPSVEFRDVWFAYQGEEWVLQDVSFRAESNETLAVVGHTGAGKTTLINLLLRFYEPQRGEILVGGRDVRAWPRHELRRQFGVVLQDPYLFHGTIVENIRLGAPEVTRNRAIEAGNRVHLDQAVSRLPGGWDEPVDERGASLSAGERQLVGFARALAHNPRFLILDEATSNVDPHTELAIQDALAQLVEGHTSIVIAHRLSTVQRADRILVMHKGRVRETGAHQELLAAGGVYSRLCRLQFGAPVETGEARQ